LLVRLGIYQNTKMFDLDAYKRKIIK